MKTAPKKNWLTRDRLLVIVGLLMAAVFFGYPLTVRTETATFSEAIPGYSREGLFVRESGESVIAPFGTPPKPGTRVSLTYRPITNWRLTKSPAVEENATRRTQWALAGFVGLGAFLILGIAMAPAAGTRPRPYRIRRRLPTAQLARQPRAPLRRGRIFPRHAKPESDPVNPRFTLALNLFVFLAALLSLVPPLLALSFVRSETAVLEQRLPGRANAGLFRRANGEVVKADVWSEPKVGERVPLVWEPMQGWRQLASPEEEADRTAGYKGTIPWRIGYVAVAAFGLSSLRKSRRERSKRQRTEDG